VHAGQWNDRKIHSKLISSAFEMRVLFANCTEKGLGKCLSSAGSPRVGFLHPKARPSSFHRHFFKLNGRNVSIIRTQGLNDQVRSPGLADGEQKPANGNGTGVGADRQPPADVLDLWRKADAVCFDVDCMFPCERLHSPTCLGYEYVSKTTALNVTAWVSIMHPFARSKMLVA
jgi:hypothetical protein